MVLWRFAIVSFLKTFLLAMATFVSVLLVSRFKDIACFAVLDSDHWQTALFAVYQIPLILPMAIPISALLAAFLFSQNLSRSNELTAFRALGLSLKVVFTPILAVTLLLTALNFSICNELAPYCRRESKNLLLKGTSANPLHLLQRQKMVKINNLYLKMNAKGEEDTVKNFTLITRTANQDQLTLLKAARLKFKGEELTGTNVAIVSHLNGPENQFDTLIIENQKEMTTAAPILTSFLKKSSQSLDGSSLNYQMLRFRIGQNGSLTKEAAAEMLRRGALTLGVLSFTLLGLMAGIEEGRSPSKKPIYQMLALILLALASLFLGKGLSTEAQKLALVFFVPHIWIFMFCLARYQKIARGAA